MPPARQVHPMHTATIRKDLLTNKILQHPVKSFNRICSCGSHFQPFAPLYGDVDNSSITDVWALCFALRYDI